MIDNNILKSLESTFQDPSFSIIVSKFEQLEYCNKDKVKIYLEQFNPNLEKIIQDQQNDIEILKNILTENEIQIPNLYTIDINSCVEKVLTIESIVDVDQESKLFISKLSGSINNGTNKEITDRTVEGKLHNKNITITKKDYPNYFSRIKFKVNNDKLIVSIPKQVDTLIIKIQEIGTEDIDTYTESDIINNKITTNTLNLAEKEYMMFLRYTVKPSVLQETFTKKIESITTTLEREIELNLNNEYTELPGVIVTIDEKDKIYSSYETSFEKNNQGKYNKVTIKFNNLKRQKEYGDVNIIVIGITDTTNEE